MAAGDPFQTRFEDLPPVLPVFPLSGVLLLPRGKLPLNIFEPRYLAMVEDALGQGRLIGMIQPQQPEAPDGPPPTLYSVGCAGRISSFSETDDGRLLITLTGTCRFAVRHEIDCMRGYRRVVPDWEPFRADLTEETPTLDREALFGALRPYFRQTGIDVHWEMLEQASDLALLTSLAMVCPFDATEKQALLDAPTAQHRCQVLLALLQMAVAQYPRAGSAQQ